MCDIAGERQKIDGILERAAGMEPMRDCIDEKRLTEFALAVLRDHYSDACPDECLRRRCMDFAALLARRREAERQAAAHAKACAISAMRSSSCSMPIDMRMSDGVMPISRRASSVSPE